VFRHVEFALARPCAALFHRLLHAHVPLTDRFVTDASTTRSRASAVLRMTREAAMTTDSVANGRLDRRAPARVSSTRPLLAVVASATTTWWLGRCRVGIVTGSSRSCERCRLTGVYCAAVRRWVTVGSSSDRALACSW
jgi:hypothetical protein